MYVIYGWHVKVYANDIVPKEGILLDRKGVRHVDYLSGGVDSGVPVAAVDLEQILETQ